MKEEIRKKQLNKYRFIQSINMFIVLVVSLIVQFLKYKQLAPISNMAAMSTEETVLFVLIIQLFTYMKQPRRCFSIIQLYFIMNCMMMYYSHSIYDILSYSFNLGMTLALSLEGRAMLKDFNVDLDCKEIKNARQEI